MNIERLTIIAEWLEAGAPHKDGVGQFYMPTIFDEATNACGTSACIAGCAIQWFGSKKEKKALIDYHIKGRVGVESNYVGGDAAAEKLGLTDEQANSLFFPDSYGGTSEHGMDGAIEDLTTVTPTWAARTIRHLIATGEVDWLGNEHPKESP